MNREKPDLLRQSDGFERIHVNLTVSLIATSRDDDGHGSGVRVCRLDDSRAEVKAANLKPIYDYLPVEVAFAGPMRTNLVDMLDKIGLAERLGLATTAALFGDASERAADGHDTSPAARWPGSCWRSGCVFGSTGCQAQFGRAGWHSSGRPKGPDSRAELSLSVVECHLGWLNRAIWPLRRQHRSELGDLNVIIQVEELAAPGLCHATCPKPGPLHIGRPPGDA